MSLWRGLGCVCGIMRGEGPVLTVALSWWRGGDRRRFVLRPRGCSQAGMTHAGQTKQTSDVRPFPTRPVCLPGQGLQATQVVSSLCGERSTCPGGGAPTPT